MFIRRKKLSISHGIYLKKTVSVILRFYLHATLNITHKVKWFEYILMASLGRNVHVLKRRFSRRNLIELNECPLALRGHSNIDYRSSFQCFVSSLRRFYVNKWNCKGKGSNSKNFHGVIFENYLHGDFWSPSDYTRKRRITT